MRLWHKDLIPVLPRQQLLSQWRELCCIVKNVNEHGFPNHVLVNKIMDFYDEHLHSYAVLVFLETRKRGYKCDFKKFYERYEASFWYCYGREPDHESLFADWMNDRYLTQCYYNLQEKYDCGAISEEEWRKIEERYEELMGK